MAEFLLLSFSPSVCLTMRLLQYPAMAPMKVCVYLTVVQTGAQMHVDMPHVCMCTHASDPVLPSQNASLSWQ